jgi:DNA mismatch repair protein MutL
MTFKIKILPDFVVNKIAAGEVVERPVSVVKELIENSIDADSSKIDIHIRGGGKNEIIVVDNGLGILEDDLLLSVRRHATSKILNENLTNISTLGFRGEALSSISSVSDFFLSTNSNNTSLGFEINLTAGKLKSNKPINKVRGTTIKVKNLFFNIPARLKFLKSDNYEALLIKRIVQKFSLSFLDIEFNLFIDDKKTFQSTVIKEKSWDEKLLLRSTKVLGKDCLENSIKISEKSEKFLIRGLLGIPTFNFSNSNNIFFFVNNRIVSDKSITSIIRVAYRDFLSHDRFPQLVLFVDCSSSEVDINVHPMKHEVRFRDLPSLKSLIINSIKKNLEKTNHLASSINSKKAINQFIFNEEAQEKIFLNEKKIKSSQFESKDSDHKKNYDADINTQYPLGFAKTQLHDTYIISENKKGIVITDQHAAHERIVYEKLKKDYYGNEIKRQILLIPAIIELDNLVVKNIEKTIKVACEYGVKIEIFGNNSIIVREIPVILGNCNIKEFVLDLIDELVETSKIDSLEEKINKVCSSMACHGSIRAGRNMEVDEMNDLLRRMEDTPFSGQCNHGRPTYVELKLNDIEKLFGRK